MSSRICRNGSERSKALTFRGLRDESGNERGTAGTTMMGRMADRGREKDSEPENESKTKGKPNNLVFPLRDRRDGGNNGRPGVRLRSEVEENWIRNRIYSILFARDDENLNSSGTRLSIFLYLSIYLSIYPSLSLSLGRTRRCFPVYMDFPRCSPLFFGSRPFRREESTEITDEPELVFQGNEKPSDKRENYR